METFGALWTDETEAGNFTREIRHEPVTVLPDGDVLVRVSFSSLNYKDALSATGNRGVTRSYPHIPGIDASGVVLQSRDPEFRSGDEVLVTGYDLGSNTHGGWSELIRVPAAWVVRRPEDLTLRACMIFGTAGFTAGLSVKKLLDHGMHPDDGPVLVTGATGGVGCMAVSMLAKVGFKVVAATGKTERDEFLRQAGAAEVVTRDDVSDRSGKPLLSGRWAGVVDTVGGHLLDSAIRQTRPEGAVACCGNIGSEDIHSSIYPFILRGVTLYGIGSAFTPMRTRLEVWNHVSGDWKPDGLEHLAIEVGLEELNNIWIERILAGKVSGRVIVRVPGK